MQNDFFMFLGILVIIFAAWIATGGPSRPISFSGPYLNPITQPGGPATAYGNPSQYSDVDLSIGLGGISNNSQPSSYKGVVYFNRSAQGAIAHDSTNEHVIIKVAGNASTPVSLAGWKIVSTQSGNGNAFPSGVEVPRSGRVNQSGNIVLRPGDEAIISTGRSPIGISFRQNRCTGYFEQNQDFIPELPLSCPLPLDELNRYESDADDSCRDYVRTVGTCQIARNAPSGSCREFVEDYLTYEGCLSAHQNESGFSSPTWRIYLGKNGNLWNDSHDTITLVDANGNVVDTLSY